MGGDEGQEVKNGCVGQSEALGAAGRGALSIVRWAPWSILSKETDLT